MASFPGRQDVAIGRPAKAILLVFALAMLTLADSLAGAEPARLTHDGRLKMDPVFVNQGHDIVFTVLESPTQTVLNRIRLEGHSEERLHPKAATAEFEAVFSPDDRYCAYVQSRGNLTLRLVIHDTRESKESTVEPGGGFSGMRHPSISPTSRSVVFSMPGAGGQHIASTDLQAQNRKQLTQGDSLNFWPSFSPDGQSIAFGSSRDGDFDIYVMKADGNDVRRLAASPGRDMRPSWSPDGRRMAFTSARDGNPEIYVVNVDGTGLVRVTDHPEQDDYASWHPDGRRLVMVSERSGKFDLYLIDAPSS
jgi:Tol biopolymer transport system component